ncbi:hypothetical protein TWF281_009115 [Arthrobotrys megalospora]
MATKYILSPEFLARNIKPLPSLDLQKPTFEVVGYEPVGVSDQAGSQKVEDAQGENSSCMIVPDRNDPPHELAKYSMPCDEYLEIRDQVVSSFLKNPDGGLAPEEPNIILRSEHLDTGCIQGFVEYLVRDIRANLIWFDINHLEELAVHFHHQDSEQADRCTCGVRHNFGTMFPTQTSDSGSNNIDKYFAAPKLISRHANPEINSRNKAAFAAILDTESFKNLPDGDVQPLVIFLRDANNTSKSNIHKGRRILARIRDAIAERRSRGVPIMGIFSWIGPDSDFITFRDPAPSKRTGAGELFKLPENPEDIKTFKKRQTAQNRETNVRQLKQGLKRRFSDLVDDELVGAEADWGCNDMRNADSLLGREEMPTKELNRVIRLVGARARGKAKIEPRDVMTILERTESRRVRANKPIVDTSGGEITDPRLNDLPMLERELSKHAIAPGQSSLTYDDVVMNPNTKATIQELLHLSKLGPSSNSGPLFENFKMAGILFYGPPGTGKTQLCRAIANDSGQTFISLTAADLQSCFVGQTEKTIQAVFSLARKLYPSILFLDEVDSLFYGRQSGDKSWQRTALNQYLHEMDGLSSQTANAPLVIVATNRPADLDAAFLRRLPHKVYFDLPSRRERREILRGLLKKDGLGQIDLNHLARRTTGFSGSDLKNLCSQAILAWATDNRMKGGASAFDGKIELTMEHFGVALSRTGPTTSPELLEGLLDFRRRCQT